jgi:hypothetical protein
MVLRSLEVRGERRSFTSIIGMLPVIPYRKSLLMGRLSGYILLLLVLSTAHLGGAHSTWALSKGGVMKVTRILAFWVGLPAIALGLVIRTR